MDKPMPTCRALVSLTAGIAAGFIRGSYLTRQIDSCWDDPSTTGKSAMKPARIAAQTIWQIHLWEISFYITWFFSVIATWVPSLGSCFRQLAFLSALVAKRPQGWQLVRGSQNHCESVELKFCTRPYLPGLSLYLYMIQGAVEPASTTVVQGTGFEAAIFVSQRSWHEGLLSNESSPGEFAPRLGAYLKDDTPAKFGCIYLLYILFSDKPSCCLGFWRDEWGCGSWPSRLECLRGKKPILNTHVTVTNAIHARCHRLLQKMNIRRTVHGSLQELNSPGIGA